MTLDEAMDRLRHLGITRTEDNAETHDEEAAELCCSYGPSVVRLLDELYEQAKAIAP